MGSDLYRVSDIGSILAAVTLVASTIFYFWTPNKKEHRTALGIYLLLVATTAYLVVDTGGVSSPFIAIWMVAAIFGGIFRAAGLLPLFVAVNVYLVLGLFDGSIAKNMIVSVVLAGELPLALSYLIWHSRAHHESGKDRAYRDLANELSQVANKSEVVINAIADGVIAVDSRGVIQLINPAAQQIIGWGKQDALALDYKSVLKMLSRDGKEVEPTEDPVAMVLANNVHTRTDNLGLLTNSGKKLLISVIVSPVGQPGSGAIIVFRDITSEKIEERQQAEFISTASHEMRTPVASIEGYLGLTLNPTTATIDAKARDFITKAHEAAQHLGRLFQDLLDVTRADDGRLVSKPSVIDVVVFTRDIVQGLLPRAAEKKLRLFYKPIPDITNEHAGERTISPVFYAHVDSDHLREIIANLIENAIKYTPTGEVIVDITGTTEHITLSVADSGIGIPPEDIPHLFQKFYRVDSSDTREIGGTGLGLYLCRRLAEALGGRVWVESEYKKGSTFFVEIPRIDHEKAMQLIEAAGMQQPAIQDSPVAAPAWQVHSAEETRVTPPHGPTSAAQAPTNMRYNSAPVATVPQGAPQQQSVPAVQPAAPVQPQAAPTLAAIEQAPAQYISSRPNPNVRPVTISVPERKP